MVRLRTPRALAGAGSVRALALASALALTASGCASGGGHAARGAPSGLSSASPRSADAVPAPSAVSPSVASPTPPASPAPSATTLSGTPSARSTASPPATLLTAKIGTRDQAPWSAVGPGWFLVIDDATPAWMPDSGAPEPPPGQETLWLIGPNGDRYSILTWTHGDKTALDGARLADWSSDGKRALLVNVSPSATNVPGYLVQVDLTTGVATSAPAPDVAGGVYLGDDDTNVAALLDGSGGSSSGSAIAEVAIPRGTLTTLASGDGPLAGLVAASDGATLYAGDGDHLLAVSAASGTPSAIPVVPGGHNCTPLSWWAKGSLLVTCQSGGAMRMWSVPVAGLTPAGPPVAFTAAKPGLYYDNAVRAGDVIALQHPVACGTEDIHVLGADGVGTKLAIGGSLGNDHLVGADGDKIAVRSSTECGVPSWFGFVDPTTGVTSIVLPGSAAHTGPGSTLAFPTR